MINCNKLSVSNQKCILVAFKDTFSLILVTLEDILRGILFFINIDDNLLIPEQDILNKCNNNDVYTKDMLMVDKGFVYIIYK